MSRKIDADSDPPAVQPGLPDSDDLLHALESPLRLRLIGELLVNPDLPLTLSQAVVRSGRHVQDVVACLRPLVRDGVLEEVEHGSAFRLRPDLPPPLLAVLHQGIEDRGDQLRRERHVRHQVLGGMIGVDPKMQLIFETIRQLSRIDVPVLIDGETGTGKELVARAIHDLGTRRSRTFGAANCATLPETLFESEMFGHVRGAFTGAVRDQLGLVERCDGGTLFLDEIGDLSLANQVKLLRVLQDRSFTPLGGGSLRTSDFRLISATNRDLGGMVTAQTFREDLYYRINVFQVRVPSLRERLNDIPYLAEGILAASAERLDLRDKPRGLSPEAVSVLQRHTWPGNIRELQNVVLRAAIASAGELIRPEHVPLLVAEAVTAGAAAPMPGHRTLAEVERDHIARVLKAERGRIQTTAAILGISRTTLYKKIRDYKIEA